MTKIYGIKNCDTMKKTFKWLDTNSVSYDFHDYKKNGLDLDVLALSIATHGWENVLNRRGTTWRKLPDNIKENMNAELALQIAQENPSIIKRPLLVHKNKSYLGFKDTDYQNIFVT